MVVKSPCWFSNRESDFDIDIFEFNPFCTALVSIRTKALIKRTNLRAFTWYNLPSLLSFFSIFSYFSPSLSLYTASKIDENSPLKTGTPVTQRGDLIGQTFRIFMDEFLSYRRESHRARLCTIWLDLWFSQEKRLFQESHRNINLVLWVENRVTASLKKNCFIQKLDTSKFPTPAVGIKSAAMWM